MHQVRIAQLRQRPGRGDDAIVGFHRILARRPGDAVGDAWR